MNTNNLISDEDVQITSGDNTWIFSTDGTLTLPGGSKFGDISGEASNSISISTGFDGYSGLLGGDNKSYVRCDYNGVVIGTHCPEHNYQWGYDNQGCMMFPGPAALKVYKNTEHRDRLVLIPYMGMMIYVMGIGVQVYGLKEWNTIPGTDK